MQESQFIGWPALTAPSLTPRQSLQQKLSETPTSLVQRNPACYKLTTRHDASHIENWKETVK